MSKKKIIDLSYLKEISNGDNMFMIELIDMFFEQIPEYQVLLKEFFDKKEWLSLGRTAHKAKSSIIMMGLNDLGKELKWLEENAKEETNIDHFKEIIAKFVCDSNQAIEELKQARKEITKI